MTGVTHARSRVANEAKRAKRLPNIESDQRLADARRDLATAKLEAYIKAVLAKSLPLSKNQLSQLALLLHAPACDTAPLARSGDGDSA